MKPSRAANDNQIDLTRQVWKPRLGRDLTNEDARQITQNVTGLFGILAEWSRAEKLEPGDLDLPQLDRRLISGDESKIEYNDAKPHRAF